MNFRSLWLRPDEQMPRIPVGDRIVIIVADRPRLGAHKRPRMAILEMTETGWESEEGYSPEDAILWATEKSVLMCVEIPLEEEDLQ